MSVHAIERIQERAPWANPWKVAQALREMAAVDVDRFADTVTGGRVYRLETIGRPPLYGIFMEDNLVTVLTGGMTLHTPTADVVLPAEPKLLGPGVYDLDAETYHRDPCTEPALSASLAHRMLTATPRHAWWDSWRLNPEFEAKDRDHFDIGSAFHELNLGKGRGIKHIEADDFRTKAAKEARDAARADGFTPLKTEHYELVQRMSRLTHEQLDRSKVGNPLKDAELEREVTIIWQQDGILCRIMVDLLDRKRRIAWDLKTCAGLAEPEGWLRKSMDHGADMRAAHYVEGLEATFGGRWRYIFVVVEKDPPHCLSLPTITEGGLWIGRQKMEVARRGWRQSLRSDRWQGWPLDVTPVEPPEYLTNRWVGQAEAQEARFKPKPTEGAKAAAYGAQSPH